MPLRDYQTDLTNGIFNSLQHHRSVLAVLPTGGGKTVCMSHVVRAYNAPTVCIAHRQELVSQISMTLARDGVRHNIIAANKTIKFIVEQHVIEYGRSFYDNNSHIYVAGVDTLIRRNFPDADRVQFWHTDEGHHQLPGNKWGRAVNIFPNARGIGWTATPLRADRKSLSQSYDDMVTGPTMRELIDHGHLCDYKIYGPEASIDVSSVPVTSTGDYSGPKLSEASAVSSIVGDVVAHYLRIAPGKRGITFAINTNDAAELADAFNEAGVPAAMVDAKTPDHVRVELVRRFRNGDLMQLVNVDIFGEGFDLPAIEVVSMARPTQSYGLYVQQFGRALRTLPGKTHGIIIDHVENVKRHKLPDGVRGWTLETTEKPGKSENITPVRTCENPECLLAYEGFSKTCPYCGHKPAPVARSAPEQVEGDLTEYGPELLEELRKEAARMMQSPQIPPGAHAGIKAGITNKWNTRKQSQTDLRDAIALWAGVRRDVYNEPDSDAYIRFYHTFGVDVLTAQTLPAKKADVLAGKIWETVQDYR